MRTITGRWPLSLASLMQSLVAARVVNRRRSMSGSLDTVGRAPYAGGRMEKLMKMRRNDT